MMFFRVYNLFVIFCDRSHLIFICYVASFLEKGCNCPDNNILQTIFTVYDYG